jgi:2-iminobutanoate/2-iminopropanoate deaminase
MKYPPLWIAICIVASCVIALAQENSAGKTHVEFRNSPEISSPAGYSHVAIVSSGKLVFISGQVGLDKQGGMVGKTDFRAQAAQAFSNLKSALAAAGATPNDVVKLNYYVVGLDPAKLLALRGVRDQFINKGHPPTSTLAGVLTLFREDALIEIEAVAVIP